MSLQERADYYAKKYNVDPALYRRLIAQESAWNPKARSPVGAYGLSQVMPDTARNPGFGVSPLTNFDDPEEQLRFGAEYLAANLKRYGGDVNKALAAYNWGAGNADKWDGDPNKLPKETRDYIAKVGRGEGSDLSFGPVQGSPETMAFLPQGQGQGDPAAGIYSDPAIQAQYVEPEEEPMKYQKWLREKMPWIDKKDNRDTLLAIGAGLLSGDDWASGGAAAAENVLALRKERRGRDEARINSAAEFARRQQQTSDPNNVKKYRIGNVKMPDGSYRSDLSHGTDGRIYDAAGNPIDPTLASQIVEVNNSLAGGDKGQLGANDAMKAQATLMTQKAGLEAIDRVYTYLDNDPVQGIGKVMQSVDAMYRTLMDRGLTEEQINRAVAEGDMQALIGQTREAVVGPGVMTEPDAVRVMAALGGDLKSILRNPDAFKARLEVVYKDMTALYNTGYEQYETTRQAYPNLNYIPLERYQGRTVPPVGTTAEQAAKGTQPVEVKVSKLPASTVKAGDIEFTQEELDALSPEDREFVLQQSGQTTPSNESKVGSDLGEGVFSGLEDSGIPSHYPFGPEVWATLPDDVKRMWVESEPRRR